MNSPRSVLLYGLRHTGLLLTVLALAVGVRPSEARAQQIYWSDLSDIWRANTDGTGAEIVIVGQGGGPRGIFIEPFSDKIYWSAEYCCGAPTPILRANLDGSNVEELLITTFPRGIAVDPTASKMYWFEGSVNKIRRANTDGSNIETLIRVGADAFSVAPQGGIALDIAGGKMYWTNIAQAVNGLQTVVHRANLDGSNIEGIVVDELPEDAYGDIVSEPLAIALDLSAGKVYWTEITLFYSVRSRIRRANLDGSQVEDLVNLGFDLVPQIALDLHGGKMYWVRHTGFDATSRIQRANLDGSNVETFMTGLYIPAIAIDPGCRGVDCQRNGIPDTCDIEMGISADCNANDIPDECEADCNDNGITDDCETDSDGDGVIDECDGCPLDPERTSPGSCGCNSTSEENADDDGDSIPNCIDACRGVDDGLFGPCQPALIPTVSQWGLLTMCLLLLAAGKVSSTRSRLGVCVRRAG